MRAFTLSPPVKAWFDAIVAAHPDAPAPPLPPPSGNPEEIAFYNAFLIPLAALKGQIVAQVPPPAPDPYALDASGQPLHPEMWGTSGGGP